MAKSLRSKAKRHFRLLRRDVVSNHPHVLAQEEARQAAMDAAVAAPKLSVPANKEEGGMDAEEGPASAEAGGMDVDTTNDLPEVTLKNSRKILTKLRTQRSAKSKAAAAATAKTSQKKKVSNLAGASQFHKRKTKRRR